MNKLNKLVKRALNAVYDNPYSGTNTVDITLFPTKESLTMSQFKKLEKLGMAYRKTSSVFYSTMHDVADWFPTHSYYLKINKTIFKQWEIDVEKDDFSKGWGNLIQEKQQKFMEEHRKKENETNDNSSISTYVEEEKKKNPYIKDKDSIRCYKDTVLDIDELVADAEKVEKMMKEVRKKIQKKEYEGFKIFLTFSDGNQFQTVDKLGIEINEIGKFIVGKDNVITPLYDFIKYKEKELNLPISNSEISTEEKYINVFLNDYLNPEKRVKKFNKHMRKETIKEMIRDEIDSIRDAIENPEL